MDVKLIGFGYGLYVIENIDKSSSSNRLLYDVANDIDKNCLKAEDGNRLIISRGGINEEEKPHEFQFSVYEEFRDFLLSSAKNLSCSVLTEKIQKIEYEYEILKKR